jgi:high-affinity nickel permease
MFGLDSWLVHFSDGSTLAIVVLVAVLLGLRHASDPDHLAAVTTLVTNGRGGATRLGLAWGLGHASSLLVLGVPIVLWQAYVPGPVE